jgi:hypothetical protein
MMSFTFRNIWDGFHITQNKKKFGYKTLFEVNGLPSIELKYHYPGLDSELLAKIKEQELATLHLSDAIICPSRVTRDYIASLGLNRQAGDCYPERGQPFRFFRHPVAQSVMDVSLSCCTSAPSPIGRAWISSSKPCRKFLNTQAVRLHIVGRGRSRQRKMLAKQIRKLGLEEHVIVQPAVPHHEIPALIAMQIFASLRSA